MINGNEPSVHISKVCAICKFSLLDSTFHGANCAILQEGYPKIVEGDDGEDREHQKRSTMLHV